VIETARILLRRWQPEDARPFARINADGDVMRFIGDGRPLTREESDELLSRIERHWAEHGFGLWAAEERGGELIGFAGLAVPSFLPSVLPAVEVGWRLTRSAWGRGLATEAGRASLAHAWDALGLRQVLSIIDPANAASMRVAQKLGMRRAADRLNPRTGRRVAVMEADRP
jgi:RimJ/RimL family protein N-acetyltransferase